MTTETAPSFLPYHEPSIVQILTLASFCLALNAVNSILDAVLYCGLVGQVLIGTAWGAPGARWLDDAVQEAVVKVGYLGLVLVVYEGGLSTSINTVRANLALSTCVALTGIAAPIALSFLLGPVAFGATPIQCFAAGAALCSTSLGTTFTVLKTSGLETTRLGAVLTTAAMMDDVAGLVMVQIVASGLSGNSTASIAPMTVLRPILVSLAFAVALPLVCRYLLIPAVVYLGKQRPSQRANHGWFWPLLNTREAALATHTALLILLVAAASWAGASVLLAAYITGVLITWWDSQKTLHQQQEPAASTGIAVSGLEFEDTPIRAPRGEENNDRRNTASNSSSEPHIRSEADTSTAPSTVMSEHQVTRYSGQNIYDTYYAQAVNRVLKPFFFVGYSFSSRLLYTDKLSTLLTNSKASIGFSIPISKMFNREVLWRGIVYSVLMVIGKLLCGIWLVRFSFSIGDLAIALGSSISLSYSKILSRLRQRTSNTHSKHESQHVTQITASPSQPIQMMSRHSSNPISSQELRSTVSQSGVRETPAKPVSLYPSTILASAMVARGEIGFLVSAIAESNGIFRLPTETPSDASQLFLVVTWAIVLCTVLGPLCLGVLVSRLKNLEKYRPQRGARDALGVWGVQ